MSSSVAAVSACGDCGIQWDDPANELVISSGPIGGTTNYPGSGKSIVVSLSPLTGGVIDSNAGGYFGPYLKFAGWDALELQGKAADDAPRDIAAISTVSTGVGAENSRWGCLNFSFYDLKRGALRVKQAGRGGTGTVFRDKRIAALVVKSPPVGPMSNQPADLKRIQEVGTRITKEIMKLDASQCDMRRVGTAHLVEIMDEYDLLPTHNYKFGRHPDSGNISSSVWRERFGQNMPDACWLGCTMSCSHAVDDFLLQTGPYKGCRVLVEPDPTKDVVSWWTDRNTRPQAEAQMPAFSILTSCWK